MIALLQTLSLRLILNILVWLINVMKLCYWEDTYMISETRLHFVSNNMRTAFIVVKFYEQHFRAIHYTYTATTEDRT